MSETNDIPTQFEEFETSRDAIVAAALDCIVTIDAEGRVVEFNPAAEETFGFKREEVLGLDLAELILPPEFREAHHSGMARFQKERTSRIIGRRLHLEAVRRNGDRFPIELTVTAYRNPDGEPEYTAYLRDRTEGEQERQRREEAAARFRQVTENMDGVIALLEWPSARLLHMSGSYGSSFQLPEDAFERDPDMWESLVAPEHRHLIAPIVERDPEIKPMDVEVRRSRKQSWLRLRIHPVHGEDGKVERIVAHTESITERKRVESTLEQTRFVLDKVADAIYLMGRDARFVYANEAAAKMLGYSREELVGMTVFQIDAVMRPEHWPNHWAELESSETMSIESRHRRKDGTEFPVEVRLSYTEFDGVAFNCAVVRDSSERQEAEAAVQAALEEARSAQGSREVLLTNLAHELRTPLAAAAGLIDLIVERSDDPHAVAEWGRSAARSCARLGHLVDTALALESPATAPVRRDLRSVDLVELVRMESERSREEAVKRGLSLDISAVGACPSTVLMDSRWVGDVLERLLSNAIKFTRKGRVGVEVSATPSSLGARMRIEVQDSGAGMEQERIEAAFQNFVRLGPNAKGVDEGIGLGLAVARQAVEANGGELFIRSAPGRGTRAIIEIDVELGDDPSWVRLRPEAPASPVGARPTLMGKILVVEDAPELAQLYARWLSDWGLTVEIAGDGGTALERLTNEEFDLAIVDWRLPVMDGLELTTEVRARGSYMPILAITAENVHGARERCLEAGCSAFLPKPVDRGELLALLHEYLVSAGSRRAGPRVEDSEPDEAWREDLKRRFVRSVAEDARSLATAVDEEDRHEAQRLAHRLKGGSTTFGLMDLAEVARKIESLDVASAEWQASALELMVVLDEIVEALS